VAVSPIAAPGRTDCRLQKDGRRSAILDAAHVLAASGGGWASAGRGAEAWAVPIELDAERRLLHRDAEAANAVAENTAKKQRRRPFKAGRSGNPEGRPRGSRNKATMAVEALLDGEAKAIARRP
jgi:Family of unknown function (DUF5681)